jgi:hypothetical protein
VSTSSSVNAARPRASTEAMLRGGRFGLKPGGLDDLEQRGPGAEEHPVAGPAEHLLETQALVGRHSVAEMRDGLHEALVKGGVELGVLLHKSCIVA